MSGVETNLTQFEYIKYESESKNRWKVTQACKKQ